MLGMPVAHGLGAGSVGVVKRPLEEYPSEGQDFNKRYAAINATIPANANFCL